MIKKKKFSEKVPSFTSFILLLPEALQNITNIFALENAMKMRFSENFSSFANQSNSGTRKSF